LTATPSAGHYGANGKCYTVSAEGVVTSVTTCIQTLNLCYTPNVLIASTMCTCITQSN
jgi:hypothetical protein